MDQKQNESPYDKLAPTCGAFGLCFIPLVNFNEAF